MNRRLIKSEHATIKVPECELEIPPITQKGKLTTVEGFLATARDQLSQAFEEGIYDSLQAEAKSKIQSIIKKLDDVVNEKNLPVTLTLDDPSGNSFIENPFAPQSDPYIKVKYYERTKEMAESMGYMIQPDANKEKESENKINPDSEVKVSKAPEGNQFVNPTYYDKKKDFTVYKSKSEISAHLLDFTKSIDNGEGNIKEEALRFPTNCYCCHAPGENLMCLCTIPFFKEIIIACFKCQECGYKSTDVKGGGGMSDKATKITLNVKSQEDLNRDCFKSESAKLIIPHLEFETDTGSMGSMFTTVEGLIEKLITNLNDTPFSQGDSMISDNFQKFIQILKDLITEPVKEFTIILDDPLSNCFIASMDDPNKDANLIKEEYERTWEQNEELGINDMKVENYEVEEQGQGQEENQQNVEQDNTEPSALRRRGG